MDFYEQITTKKGIVGERIANDFLIKQGWTLYSAKEQRHQVDFIAMKKNKTCMIEVKCKARRNKYPDTGFNYSQYVEYKNQIELTKLPLFVFFVDEQLKQIYYCNLTEESKPKERNGITYPLIYNSDTKGKIIFFYQPDMKVLCNLSERDVLEIKGLSSRNYDYSIQYFINE